MLAGARYYDPAVGLFITRDTLLSQPPYQYCNDDPINAVDPSGHFSWSELGNQFKEAIQLDSANPVMMSIGVAGSVGTIWNGAFGSGLYGPDPGIGDDIGNGLGGALGTRGSVGVIDVGIGLIGAGGAAVIGAPILIGIGIVAAAYGIGEVAVSIGRGIGWL